MDVAIPLVAALVGALVGGATSTIGSLLASRHELRRDAMGRMFAQLPYVWASVDVLRGSAEADSDQIIKSRQEVDSLWRLVVLAKGEAFVRADHLLQRYRALHELLHRRDIWEDDRLGTAFMIPGAVQERENHINGLREGIRELGDVLKTNLQRRL
jgi:hypothetical protein